MRAFQRYARVRRHARLTADVAKLGAWFATHGRTSIADGSGIVASFEAGMRQLTGARFALAMNSGTATLHSAYFAVGVGPGDEVLVPSYTWHSTAAAALQVGAVPVFCDVDPSTLTVDVGDVARRITPRTKAICVVHIWGNPAAIDGLVALGESHGIPVIEDCSHAHGATFAGRPVGSWGAIGCFSLNASKPVSGGEAGVAVTSDPLLFDRMLLLGHSGRLAAGQAAASYDVDDMSLGVKYRPHPFAIHLATSQLARLQRHNARCREIWNAIVGELEGARALAPVSTLPSATRGGYYAFVLSYDPEPGMPPLATVVERARAAGVPITTDPYAGRPLHRAPLFAAPDPAQRAHALLGSADVRSHEASPADGTLPETERLAGRLLAFEHLMYLSSPSYARSCTRRLVDATGGRRPSRQGPAMQGLREEPTGGLGPPTSTHA